MAEPYGFLGSSRAGYIRNQFINNIATFRGAVYSNRSAITAKRTFFQEDHSTKSGSAIHCYFSSLLAYSCSFKNKSAHISGGAVYLENAVPEKTTSERKL